METSIQSPQVKITVIYDNRCDNSTLQEGWGFSILIESENRKILFDTGGNWKAFSSNIEKLKISLKEITHVVFSHRHWDHVEGSKEVLKSLRDKTEVFLPKFFFRPLFKKSHSNLVFKTVKSFAEIDKNIFSLVLKGGFFLYEQSLIINTSQGMCVLTGCAHPGIVNILQAAQDKLHKEIHFVMGGFHLVFSPADVSADILQKFQDLGVKKVAPCHCSGDHTIRQFQEMYGDHFFKVGTGSVIRI